MTKKNQMNLAKVLLSFSFVLILLGISFDLENKVTINPITNTHTISQTENENINITTTDKPVDPAPSSENTNTNNQTTNNNTTNNSSNNSNSGKSNASNATTPPQNTQSPIETPTQPSIETTNDNLRKNIESRYGISIRYGAKTNGYTVAGLSTIMLTDANRINQLLGELNSNLALYPSGFFNETKEGGYTLTLYLIKQYSQANVTGITDSTTKNVLISLATDYSFTESLHHEIYHYIEKYMYTRGANYTTWNTLNPAGFNYGATNATLSYTSTGSANAYFVNNYAQTDQYEDRASTFEYMMDTEEAICLQTGTTIWKKAKYISEQIDAVFRTVSPNITEYWERYVYN